MSVRSTLSQEEIQQAERLYRAINSGSCKGDGRLQKLAKGVGNLSLGRKFPGMLSPMAIGFTLMAAAVWISIGQVESSWDRTELLVSCMGRGRILTSITSPAVLVLLDPDELTD